MSKVPMVSVCIPTYNSAKYLQAAMASVFQQDFADYELIIVDNASEDDTDTVVAAFRDQRIKYYKNASNVGALENHNICLGYASGKYVKFLCADDVLLPGIISKMVEALEQSDAIGLVAFDILVTDHDLLNGRRYNHYPGRERGEVVVNASLERVHNWIGGPSNVMFRRSLLGGLRFDRRYRWYGDFKFFCELLLQSKADFYNLDEPGCLYRRHGTSDTVVLCPSPIQARLEYDFLAEMNAFNHLNCCKLLLRPIGSRRRITLVLWLVRNIWAVKSIKSLLTATPIGPSGSLMERFLRRVPRSSVVRFRSK